MLVPQEVGSAAGMWLQLQEAETERFDAPSGCQWIWSRRFLSLGQTSLVFLSKQNYQADFFFFISEKKPNSCTAAPGTSQLSTN